MGIGVQYSDGLNPSEAILPVSPQPCWWKRMLWKPEKSSRKDAAMDVASSRQTTCWHVVRPVDRIWIKLQGVRTEASEPLSLIPTPNGVARRPQDEVFSHRGQT